MKLHPLLLALYLLIGIATFGHVIAKHKCHDHEQSSRGMCGAFSAFFWPLYWSWELQR